MCHTRWLAGLLVRLRWMNKTEISLHIFFVKIDIFYDAHSQRLNGKRNIVRLILSFLLVHSHEKRRRNDSVLFLLLLWYNCNSNFFLPNHFPFLSDFSSSSSCVCVLCIGEFCILHSHCLHFMSMYIGVTSKSVHFCRIANYMWEIVRDRRGRSQS